jgi:hypothetical protein
MRRHWRVSCQDHRAMSEDTIGPEAPRRRVARSANLSGAARRRQASARVDTGAASARHSGLATEKPAARAPGSDEAAWDRIAELLIELALEHDPAILEPGRPRAPVR